MKYLKTSLSLSIIAACIVVLYGLMFSCSSDDNEEIIGTSESASITEAVSSNYKSAVTVTVGANSIVLKSKGVPDHVTPYWGVGNALYEAPSYDGEIVNGGSMQEQNYTMTIPIKPTVASTKEETSLGPIGMALNGVAIFNDREGGNIPVDAGNLNSMDRAGAHYGANGQYHYHFSGDFTSIDDANLIGFLRDGFALYGRQDSDGTYPSDLDSEGGHTGVTADFTTAIYHYHIKNIAYLNSRFYVLKDGSYHGTKGTFTF